MLNNNVNIISKDDYEKLLYEGSLKIKYFRCNNPDVYIDIKFYNKTISHKYRYTIKHKLIAYVNNFTLLTYQKSFYEDNNINKNIQLPYYKVCEFINDVIKKIKETNVIALDNNELSDNKDCTQVREDYLVVNTMNNNNVKIRFNKFNKDSFSLVKDKETVRIEATMFFKGRTKETEFIVINFQLDLSYPPIGNEDLWINDRISIINNRLESYLKKEYNEFLLYNEWASPIDEFDSGNHFNLYVKE